MSAPLSVVIPTLNAAGQLPGTAAALIPGLSAGLIRDLVISDGGSTDATCAQAEALGALCLNGAPGRGAQLARGAAAAKGAWLLLLHADTQLSPNWVEAAETHIAQHPGMAGYFRLAFRADGPGARLTAAWGNIRARQFGLPFGDQGLLIHRDQLAAVGGVPNLPLMEDVALARALKGRLRPLPATAHTAATRYLDEGWLRRGSRNLWTQLRYFAGADPDRLAQSYRQRP